MQVDFNDRWREGLYERAFELLNVDALAKRFGNDQDMEPAAQLVSAISFVTGRVEVAITSKIQLVRSDKKNFCSGVKSLDDFLRRIVQKVPAIPPNLQFRS